MSEFLRRLKERKLVQWALAYLGAAFALLQGIDIVAQRFGWPEHTMRFVIIGLSVGFFVTLVLAWYHGERGAQRINGTELLILTLLFAIGGGFLWRFGGVASTPGVTSAATPATLPATSISEKSIAVLPFESLSEEKSNAYFADGIQDEVLTRLAKIADLKVISRTSTQKYKSAPENLREVGKQLGVANLLEGSVQKIANSVHVNVQLIRVATDEHLWAESYNRKLDDVFGVEAEVAAAIADQLNAKLSGSEQRALADKPTQSASAYDAYLRGLSVQRNQSSLFAYQQAADAYSEAVKLDPKFALAWARLAVLRSNLYFNGLDTGTNSAAAVKEAAERAMALQPELAEAWAAQGAYRYRVLRDFPGALKAYGEGARRAPNNAFIFEDMAYLERRLSLWEQADAHYKKAAELDPRNVELLANIGSNFLNFLRRFPEAHATLDRALQISPNDEGVLASQAGLFQSEGRLDEAAKMLARIGPNPRDDSVISARAGQAILERRFDDAIAIIQKLIASAEPGKPLDTPTKGLLVLLGACQELAGRKTEAQETLARAVASIKPSPDTVIPADNLGLRLSLAWAYAGLGDKEKALEQAKQSLAEYAGDAVARPGAEAIIAQIQARFGDLDSAIAALPHLLDVPAGITVADLKLNPLWDPLRKDPRFQKLCEEKPKLGSTTFSPN